MMGKTKKNKQTWSQKISQLSTNWVEKTHDVILANTQLFELRIILSDLENHISSMRESLGIPKVGFESEEESMIWLCDGKRPVTSPEKREALKHLVGQIQPKLRLTNNYKDAIEFYILTGKIGHVQANASFEIDFINQTTKIASHNHTKDQEGTLLKKLVDEINSRMGRTIGRFDVTKHRKRDPKKHSHDLEIIKL